MPEILKANGSNSFATVLSRATAILAAGGVLAYPTETFYGLGADASSEKAIRKIYTIKGRNFNSPLSVIIDKVENIHPLVGEVPASAQKLMQAFWPGALTIVFKASAEILPVLTAQTGKIGIRVSSHPVACALAHALGGPLTATSANVSGTVECTTAADVLRQLGDTIDAVIDCGETAGKKGSTLIDVTFHPPQILRHGIISKTDIENCLNLY